jgi:hypothetical protein
MAEPSQLKPERLQNRLTDRYDPYGSTPCCWPLFDAAKEAVPGTDFMLCRLIIVSSIVLRSFSGGFTKREGKPSDEEILTSRLVDRALRPFFHQTPL